MTSSPVPMSSTGGLLSFAIWVLGPYGSFFKPIFLTSPTVLNSRAIVAGTLVAGFKFFPMLFQVCRGARKTFEVDELGLANKVVCVRNEDF